MSIGNYVYRVPLNKVYLTGGEIENIKLAIESGELSGSGEFIKRCEAWFKDLFNSPSAIFTPSGTAALELAALLIGCSAQDEVIMPSFTFSSTANAFVLCGARIRFVDIDPGSMNISPDAIRAAINRKTKAIVVMHYAGVGCAMNEILDIANQHKLYLIEDAAHALMASFDGKPLGSFGHFSCFSFHQTKNIVCGEGGMLVINSKKFAGKADIIRNKGTNQKQFVEGRVNKYTWLEKGSSFLPSELQAAFLFAQLEKAKEITESRVTAWNFYTKSLKDLESRGYLELPDVPPECTHNGHIFYIKLKEQKVRDKLREYAAKNGVQLSFHYQPLHLSRAGIKYGKFDGNDEFTSISSRRIVRLPLFKEITLAEQKLVVRLVKKFLTDYYRDV